MRTKMKSSFEALSREFVGKNTIVKLQNSLKDTPVCNMLINVVCLPSASLAMHSNAINYRNFMNYEIIELASNIIAQPKTTLL